MTKLPLSPFEKRVGVYNNGTAFLRTGHKKKPVRLENVFQNWQQDNCYEQLCPERTGPL